VSATTAKALDYSTPDTVRERLEERLRAVLARLVSRLPAEANVTGADAERIVGPLVPGLVQRTELVRAVREGVGDP